MNEEELKITKEKVLEAASKCKQAKETLRTLFPEAFKKDKHFDLSQLSTTKEGDLYLFNREDAEAAGFIDHMFMQVRNHSSKYGNQAFFLSDNYLWELTRDTDGELLLIPTKK